MRESGILLHITSLDSPYGIGTIGQKAYEFIDFLKKSGVNLWQILPIGHTSYGDSPYQTFSAFAGNPYLIDLDILVSKGYLLEEDVICYKDINQEKVNYEFLYNTRYKLFEKAYENFLKCYLNHKTKYLSFKEQNKFWLDDYALFMALKYANNGMPWYKWGEDYKKHNHDKLVLFKQSNEKKVDFWKYIQFEFYEEWEVLKNYAKKNNVKIIGDVPIYVAYDSVDIWAHPEEFLVKEDLTLDVVAGVPPDYFSETGQLWGNPLYNYESMEKNGFSWWIQRIKSSLELFDYVRIDHFRGFEAYYAIPNGEKTAKNGKWIKGPGMKLFSKVKEELGEVNIIAEDLGLLTEEVYKLLDDCGFPGMKILQFAFDPYNDNPYLPHNVIENCIYYTGTHDNMTLMEWIKSLEGETKKYVYEYCDVNPSNEKAEEMLLKTLIRIALGTSASKVIIPLTDYLMLGKEGRMNTPSTSYGNWTYRLNGALDKQTVSKETIDSKKTIVSLEIKHLNKLYKRIN